MPYQSELPDTLIVNTQDLQLLTGVWFDGLWFMYGSGARRGEAAPIPNKRGRRGTNRKPLDAFTFTLPVIITPHSDAAGTVKSDDPIIQRAQVLANRRGLVDVLLGDGGLIDLELRESNLSGSYDTFTARGDFITGLNPLGENKFEAELQLQITNLDGGWLNGSTWFL